MTERAPSLRVLEPERFFEPDDELEEPEPPEELPAYLAEGIGRQDPDGLRRVIEYASARLAYLEAEAARPVDPDEIPSEPGEEVVETKKTSSGTLQKKMIPCGKDCNGCPHGPYTYRYFRKDDGSLTSEYVGKA